MKLYLKITYDIGSLANACKGNIDCWWHRYTKEGCCHLPCHRKGIFALLVTKCKYWTKVQTLIWFGKKHFFFFWEQVQRRRCSTGDWEHKTKEDKPKWVECGHLTLLH